MSATCTECHHGQHMAAICTWCPLTPDEPERCELSVSRDTATVCILRCNGTARTMAASCHRVGTLCSSLASSASRLACRCRRSSPIRGSVSHPKATAERFACHHNLSSLHAAESSTTYPRRQTPAPPRLAESR